MIWLLGVCSALLVLVSLFEIWWAGIKGKPVSEAGLTISIVVLCALATGILAGVTL